MIFEIHKLVRPGFLLKKTRSVIELWSVSSLDAPPQRKGCAFGVTLVRVLTLAERDVKANFLRLVTFE